MARNYKTDWAAPAKEHVQRLVPTTTPDECLTDWPFSSHHQHGRPQIRWEGRKVSTVHYAFFLLHGRKAQGQLNHTCHDKTCWNPHHVYEGSQKQNMGDMVDAGREVRMNARLTNQDAEEIRDRYAKGEKGRSLADRFGVPASTITQIIHNRSYKTDRAYIAPVSPLRHKLSYEKAQEIRGRRKSGESVDSLAAAFQVAKVSIYKVINNETYTNEKAKNA